MVVIKIINQLCPMLVQESGTNSQYVFLEEKWFAWNFLPDNGSVMLVLPILMHVKGILIPGCSVTDCSVCTT